MSALVVFLGGPFTAHVDSCTGQMDAAVVGMFKAIIEALEREGHIVRNAHREEKWGRAIAADVDCTRRDFDWMKECDVFVAFPGSPASPGTHVELGWATALRRPCIVITESGGSYAKLVTGLSILGDVRFVAAGAANELAARLVAEVANVRQLEKSSTRLNGE